MSNTPLEKAIGLLIEVHNELIVDPEQKQEVRTKGYDLMRRIDAFIESQQSETDMTEPRRCTCYVLPHADDCEIFVGLTRSGERVLERRSGTDRRALSSAITETMVEAAAQRMVALVMGGIIEKPQLVQWQQWAGSARGILEAAFEAKALPSETRALDLLKEARPYLDLIAPSVCKERPLVMVQTQCDVEALAKRIDGLIGEQA